MSSGLAWLGLPTPKVMASFSEGAVDSIRRAASTEEAEAALAEAADDRDAAIRRNRRVAFFAAIAVNLVASAVVVFLTLREPGAQIQRAVLWSFVVAAVIVAPSVAILARAGMKPLAVARFFFLAFALRAGEILLYVGALIWVLTVGPQLPGMAAQATDNLAALAGRAARIVNNAVGAIADFLFGDDRTKSPQEILWSRLVLGTIALAVFVLSGFLRGYAEEIGRQQALVRRR